MTTVLTHTINCPYCLSEVTFTTHENGRLEVRHHDPYGPDCEPRLRKLAGETARKHGLRLMLKN